LQTLKPALADLVRHAFGDVQDPPLPVSFPDFLTDRLVEWTDVANCLEAIGPHGAFDPRAVARELGPIFPDLMDIRVGRQEDIVLVAFIPFWTHQATGWSGGDEIDRRIGRRQRDQLAERVAAAFQCAGGGVGSLIDDDLEDGPAVIEVSGHWSLA